MELIWPVIYSARIPSVMMYATNPETGFPASLLKSISVLRMTDIWFKLYHITQIPGYWIALVFGLMIKVGALISWAFKPEMCRAAVTCEYPDQ